MSNNKPNILMLLHKDLFKNKSLNWPGILYIFAIPISLLGVISFVKTSYLASQNSNDFHLHDFIFGILYFFLVLFKIPYFSDKPIAYIQFIILSILWGISCIFMIYAYTEYKAINKKY
jgi:hypothetical protein